jgi:hypothetical protein
MEAALASEPAQESREEAAKRSSSAPVVIAGRLSRVSLGATDDVPLASTSMFRR